MYLSEYTVKGYKLTLLAWLMFRKGKKENIGQFGEIQFTAEH